MLVKLIVFHFKNILFHPQGPATKSPTSIISCAYHINPQTLLVMFDNVLQMYNVMCDTRRLSSPEIGTLFCGQESPNIRWMLIHHMHIFCVLISISRLCHLCIVQQCQRSSNIIYRIHVCLDPELELQCLAGNLLR